MKKQDISRLRKNRFVNFKLGLIGALAFITMAFNFVTVAPNNVTELKAEITLDKEDFKVIRTKHKKTTPPPPSLTPSEKIETVEEYTTQEELQPETISENIDEGEEVIFDDPIDDGEDEIEPEIDEDPIDFIDEEPVLDFAEYMPNFGNCDVTLDKDKYKECSDNALLAFFAKNIRYPAVARENGIEGRVIIKFVVDENGVIQNPRVLRGVAGGCSEEALRVLNSMPQWRAGRHGGRNVKVHFTMPISFRLSK